MPKKVCSVKWCNKPHKAKGFCNNHYGMYRRGSDPHDYKQKLRLKYLGVCMRAYVSYYNMRDRVLNKNNPRYKDYGGRGIKICNRWLESFLNFYEDMGERKKGLSLERIDNDGDYEPNNCKWATDLEQVYNRRMQHNNTSGIVGVTYDKRWRGSWKARVNDGKGNRINLGSFKTKEEAGLAIVQYKSKQQIYVHN